MVIINDFCSYHIIELLVQSMDPILFTCNIPSAFEIQLPCSSIMYSFIPINKQTKSRGRGPNGRILPFILSRDKLSVCYMGWACVFVFPFLPSKIVVFASESVMNGNDESTTRQKVSHKSRNKCAIQECIVVNRTKSYSTFLHRTEQTYNGTIHQYQSWYLQECCNYCLGCWFRRAWSKYFLERKAS